MQTHPEVVEALVYPEVSDLGGICKQTNVGVRWRAGETLASRKRPKKYIRFQ